MDAETTSGDITVCALNSEVINDNKKKDFHLLLTIIQNSTHIGTDLSECPRVHIEYQLRLELPQHLPERTEKITTKLKEWPIFRRRFEVLKPFRI
jgi:hypothetical protein